MNVEDKIAVNGNNKRQTRYEDCRVKNGYNGPYELCYNEILLYYA